MIVNKISVNIFSSMLRNMFKDLMRKDRRHVSREGIIRLFLALRIGALTGHGIGHRTPAQLGMEGVSAILAKKKLKAFHSVWLFK
jgi:hypothetical protein